MEHWKVVDEAELCVWLVLARLCALVRAGSTATYMYAAATAGSTIIGEPLPRYVEHVCELRMRLPLAPVCGAPGAVSNECHFGNEQAV